MSIDSVAKPNPAKGASKAWSDKDYLVIGMSHTQALADALKFQGSDNINVINIRADRDKLYLSAINNQTTDMPTFMGARQVFSMIGGNFHNVFGLTEHPSRFDFVYPGVSWIDTDGRWLIHYGMLREYFTKKMNQELGILSLLRSNIGFPVYHMSSPPPALSEDSIRSNPKSFEKFLHLGIAPPHLRMKLYRLHTDIIRDHCSSIGVEFMEIPPETTDENGFLLPRYCANDPTHANAAYGALVLQQILEAAK